MPAKIDVYFSIISPWAHLGHAPFLEIAGRHALEVAWRPVALPPLFAETGGLPLAKRAVERRRYRDVDLQRWSEKRGRALKLRPAHWPFDASLADRAVLALTAGGADPAGFIGAAMRGVWEEDRDLASRETIAAVLEDDGQDADAVLARAGTPEIVAAYDGAQGAAREAGVFGSPAYVRDGEVFWGQDRLDLLDEALASGRPAFRPIG